MANIKRNLVYNFLLSFSQVLIPLLTIPYISRILDPEGIGHVSFIDSFTYYFVVIAEFGITVYGIREVAKVRDQREKLSGLISELYLLHLITSSVTLVFYAVAVYFLWERIGDVRLLLFSVSFLLVSFFSCDWYFLGNERFGFITIRSVVVRVTGLISIFILVRQPADYYIYYGIIVASSVITVIWNNFILFREVNPSFKNSNWKKHLDRVWVIYLINLFYSIPLMLDNVMLRLVSTASAVGIYSFSIKVVRISTNLLADSFLVFFPRIVSLANNNEVVQLRRKLLLNVQLILLVSIPMGVGLFLIAGELALVFFGQKFIAAADDLRLLSFYPFLKSMSLFFSNSILITHHKEKSFLRNLMVTSSLFIPAALILSYLYQDYGICIALIATEFFLMLSNYMTVKKKLPLLPIFDTRTALQAVTGSLIFIPIVIFARYFIHQELLRLVISIIACMGSYALFILFIARNEFANNLMQLVLKFFKNKLYSK